MNEFVKIESAANELNTILKDLFYDKNNRINY